MSQIWASPTAAVAVPDFAFCSYGSAGNYNYNNGSMNNVGSEGNYWSRSVNNANNAYNLYFNSSNVNPGTNNNNKGNGNSVRCLR